IYCNLILKQMEKNIPFDEKTMRKFRNVNDALKVYSEQQIPQKRIVWLFQEANEIRFANTSVNASYLQQLSKAEAQKFIEKLCGKNKSKVQAFEKAVAVWKSKYDERIPDVKQPIRNVEDAIVKEKQEALAQESGSDTNA
ncbi:MAG: hypothetical protein EBR30_30830, partial [Cytophagia bacterium]|nr:hypothetical protein [Cytophagia bacterium]